MQKCNAMYGHRIFVGRILHRAAWIAFGSEIKRLHFFSLRCVCVYVYAFVYMYGTFVLTTTFLTLRESSEMCRKVAQSRMQYFAGEFFLLIGVPREANILKALSCRSGTFNMCDNFAKCTSLQGMH